MDLEEQFHSVKHAIWSLYPAGSKARVLEERPGTLVRPSWRVTYLTHRDEQITSRRYRQVIDWTIDYYGSNRADVMDQLNMFERSLRHGGKHYRIVNMIPAWRFNWQYPEVFVDAVPGGELDAGTYEVRVSGIDLCGNESAASAPQEVEIDSTNNAISIRIPRVPYSAPLFQAFVVYVDGHEEERIPMPDSQGLLYPAAVITDLLGTGDGPSDPNDTLRVRWKFLRVTGYSSSSREDDIKNGVFTGNVSLQTTIEQEHDHWQVPSVGYLQVDTTLNYSDRFSIVVGAS